MTTWYVDAASAGGNGTTTELSGANAAFATVAAAQAAITGDQHDNSLLFKRGCTWREMFTIGAYGTEGHPFTVGAYGEGALPKIYGSTQVSTWSDEGGGVWSAACAADPVSVWFVLPSGAVIWGTEVANKAACAAEYDWSYVSGDGKLYVYAATDPDSRYSSIEKPTRSYGVYANGKAYVTVQYIETAFTFASGDGRGIFLYNCTAPIVEYCPSHHNGDMGDGTDPQGNGIDVYNSPNFIARNNTCYENARRGIVVFADNGSTITDPLIEHNSCYNNYHAQIDVFANSGASGNLTNPIVRYNLCYLNSDYGAHGKGVLTAHGIYLQGDTRYITGAKVHYNIVLNMYKDSLIAVTKYATGVDIYNNVVYGAFAGSDWSPGIDIRAATVTGVNIKNNIGMDCVAGCLRVVEDDSIESCDNNLWYQSGGGAALYVDAEVGDYHFDDQAAYKTATGWDENGLWEDPDFVDPANNDLRLKAESPCINAGADVGLTEDYAGNGMW